METVTLQLNAYLIRHISAWAEVRGLTLDQAVGALLSRAFWYHTGGC